MLKNEMQHKLWVTKKTVQRKLGGKEDSCVVSSDSELDLKIQLFESISTTSQDLFRILDLYQERMSCLAMEETQLGRFLKEHGKLSQTSGKRMSTAGKAVSYSGQQRMAVRAPILRLQSELDTFRSRAVADTQATINGMERDRTEYRAALSWMKSITFDPENDRGMEKFRKAQQTVRSSKERFDRKSLDCLEKIDLLAAARCNLFQHALIAYQNALQLFARKTYETFKVASKILENEPHYAFTILRELTQTEKMPQAVESSGEAAAGEGVPEMRENAIDHDQLLFFQDDYTDEGTTKEATKDGAIINENACAKIDTDSLISVDPASRGDQLIGGIDTSTTAQHSSILEALDEGDAFFLDQQTAGGDANLLNMGFESKAADTLPSTKPELSDPLLDLLGEGPLSPQPPAAAKSMLSALSNKFGAFDGKLLKTHAKGGTEQSGNKPKSNKDISSWFKLFSELDPLANPDAMSKQIDASNSHAT